MKGIITKEFLLKNKIGYRLFYDYAEELPIIDYHCHINPAEISEDKKFDNITKAWLYGDHYKWRVMRSMGIDEKYITGDAPDSDKFMAFSKTLERCIGNPLYHWAHLELKRYFDYDGILNSDTAQEVYNYCNNKLLDSSLSVKGIINKSNVKIICTTDDPADNLEHHKNIKQDKSFNTKVYPTYRPDKYINIEKPDFNQNIDKLSLHGSIDNLSDLCGILSSRIDYFADNGCCIADFGVDDIPFEPCDFQTAETIFNAVRNGMEITPEQTEKFKTYMMQFAMERMHEKKWTVQIHFGTMRNINSRAYAALGPDTGFDVMSGTVSIKKLALFIDQLDKNGILPKTIIYSLNPFYNEAIDALCGCFYENGIKNKVQHGSAWWFNDTKSGMEAHLKSFANISVLGNFVGMLTDSRSFLSYTRHEYFRRILCNFFGCLVESGEYPEDYKTLKKIIQGICCYNAVEYFGFQV